MIIAMAMTATSFLEFCLKSHHGRAMMVVMTLTVGHGWAVMAVMVFTRMSLVFVFVHKSLHDLAVNDVTTMMAISKGNIEDHDLTMILVTP